MGFSFATLNRSLLVAGVALAVVCAAEAQNAGRRPGQAILFSSPDDDNVSSNIPPLTAKPSGMMDFAKTIQSSGSQSGLASEPDAQAVLPAPGVSSAQILRLQRQLDEQNNWALMTPEEILDVPTAEKILGVTPRDALGRPKSETAMERFYDRQNQLWTRTNNYDYGSAVTATQRDFSADPGLLVNQSLWTSAGGKTAGSPLMNDFFGGSTDSRAASAKATASDWRIKYDPSALPSGSTLDPANSPGTIQPLFQLHTLSADDGKSSASGGSLFSPLFKMSDSTPAQPVVSPLGKAFTPIGAGIATPQGVTTVPGVFGPTNVAPLFTPDWKPQAPPWMTSTPQLGEFPQRKF